NLAGQVSLAFAGATLAPQQELAQAFLGGVDVALHLHGGYGGLGQGAVRELDGVAAVFPDLVANAVLRGRGRVLDEAVAVDVAVPVYPLDGAADVGHELLEES